ncbi:MAG: diaminopimelate decarboxylase [Nitrospinae bacterium]|nr:diaminopimelate decarboxylase [Nitrospinota bacterium]
MNIENVNVRNIAKQFGTPVYVYSLRILRESIAEIMPLSPVVRFSMKSCSNAKILQEMLNFGIKIDAVSVPEIQRALKAGYEPGDICLTSDVFFTTEDAEFCLKNHIFCSCGSLGMLEEYGETRKRLGFGSDGVSIRINPGEGIGHSKKTNTGGPYSKHGIWYQNLEDAKAIAKKYELRIVGVHTHIGSGGDMEHLSRITGKLVEFAKQFPELRSVNFGGGLPYEYDPEKPQVDIGDYQPILEDRARELEEHFGRPITCEIEPGRRFVAGCGYLIGEVRSLNQTLDENNKRLNYVLTNIGFCHLLRPMAYGSYHPIWFVGDELGEETDLIVAGPVCESGDLLTQKNEEPLARRLPLPQRGDLVVIGGVGAYGHVMSSNYNSQPLIPEIMIEGDKMVQIRRRQTLDDLIREEI